jgi:putative DNA methylase
MVDDPGSVPEEVQTLEAQEAELQRLFRLIENLVLWENTTNEEVLNRARAEIKRSWTRECLGTRASRPLFDNDIDTMLKAVTIPLRPLFHAMKQVIRDAKTYYANPHAYDEAWKTEGANYG